MVQFILLVIGVSLMEHGINEDLGGSKGGTDHDGHIRRRRLVGPVIFRDRGKVAEFAELPT